MSTDHTILSHVILIEGATAEEIRKRQLTERIRFVALCTNSSEAHPPSVSDQERWWPATRSPNE